jgi:hypothetical protein
MSVFALVSGVVFLLLLNLATPDQGTPVRIFFLFSLFVFIFSLYSTISFILKKKVTNNEAGFRAMKDSFRQGLLLASLSVIALLLSVMRLLTWWDITLLAFSLVLIELYFKSDKAEGKQE